MTSTIFPPVEIEKLKGSIVCGRGENRGHSYDQEAEREIARKLVKAAGITRKEGAVMAKKKSCHWEDSLSGGLRRPQIATLSEPPWLSSFRHLSSSLQEKVLAKIQDDCPDRFNIDSFMPILVGSLNQEGNLDIMLLAARALMHICDFFHPSFSSLVHHGAIPCFCVCLLRFEDMDLSEKSLQVLEKISHNDLASIRQSTHYGHLEIHVHAFSFRSDQSAAKMHALSFKSSAATLVSSTSKAKHCRRGMDPLEWPTWLADNSNVDDSFVITRFLHTVCLRCCVKGQPRRLDPSMEGALRTHCESCGIVVRMAFTTLSLSIESNMTVGCDSGATKEK